jgi:5-aminolevulinate synthase
MDRLSSFSRFKGVCPYLGRTKARTLRTLSTTASSRYPHLTRLAAKAATKCPVMGPALTVRAGHLANGYASIAGQNSGASTADPEVLAVHERKGVNVAGASEADVAKCPHASAARQAARVAEELAAAQKKAAMHTMLKKEAAAAKCPFHAQPATPTPVKEERAAKIKAGFDYEKFYTDELEKKHQDASYRYFNNINRLAAKFPVAHTGELADEVEVWCANDYLGMGNNPVVLETMQCVPLIVTLFSIA